MNQEAQAKIIRLLDEAHAEYMVLTHPPCATSEESARARRSAGAPEATVGAKALLAAFEEGGASDKRKRYAVLVLPGFARLDSKALKKQFPEFRRFRFATPEEMRGLCGVLPGCMPPFGSLVFPAVAALVIDEGLRHHAWLGFNAADFETSIVVRSADYFRVTLSEARLGRFTDLKPAASQEPT